MKKQLQSLTVAFVALFVHCSKMKGPSASALSVRNMSTISGGVTFSQFAEAREETVNPGAELSVLKAVLLREGYLRRLVELGKEVSMFEE